MQKLSWATRCMARVLGQEMPGKHFRIRWSEGIFELDEHEFVKVEVEGPNIPPLLSWKNAAVRKLTVPKSQIIDSFARVTQKRPKSSDEMWCG
eukprot:3941128-Karenia_brevis.AAC.1